MFRDFACIPLFVVLLLITFVFAGLCYLQELAVQIRVVKDDINWMTLRRRLIEADLTVQRDYNDGENGEESN